MTQPTSAREAADRNAQAIMSGNLSQLMADITPDGDTLTTSDVPLVIAYNTDYSTDLAAATVIEE